MTNSAPFAPFVPPASGDDAPSGSQYELTDIVARCIHDPLMYTRVAYDWGQGDLRGSEGPRKWQQDILNEIGTRLQNPKTRFTPIKIAVASGHGIGKSALISMVVDWAVSTMPDTRVIVTANTENQLRTKTWPEIAKWVRSAITESWFKITATAVVAADADRSRSWRADAVPWSDTNTEAFAGLHNQGRRIVLIFDEGSSIADKVWEVAEGALTDENTEIIWLAFGNPTRNSGRFRECFERFKHRWVTKQIDSRTVEGTNKALMNQWIADYGEDSDFVRVRVRGEFPKAGSMQFVPSDIVDAARKREPVATLQDPCVIAVDVARFGDDETVIIVRRGRDASSIPWIRLRQVDTMGVAARIVDLAREHKPDAIFVDGGGVGGGVIDRLRMLKQPVIEVQFGASSDRAGPSTDNDVVYANKRAEIWGSMRDWLKTGSIPDDPALAAQLIGVEYGYVIREGRDAIMLEKKSDMKKRGLSSPDMADALAISFAYPVMPSDHTLQFTRGNTSNHQIDYNPLAMPGAQAKNHQYEYDPFRIPR